MLMIITAYLCATYVPVVGIYVKKVQVYIFLDNNLFYMLQSKCTFNYTWTRMCSEK